MFGVGAYFRFSEGVRKNHLAGCCRNEIFFLLHLIAEKHNTFATNGKMRQRNKGQGQIFAGYLFYHLQVLGETQANSAVLLGDVESEKTDLLQLFQQFCRDASLLF